MSGVGASRAAALCALLALPSAAAATGFTDHGQDLYPRTDTSVGLDGSFRLRGELLDNLDLDRGRTPSGQLLFPVPLGDPTAQTLTHADMRLRLDMAVHPSFATVAVKVRADVLDGLALGSTPDAPPVATTSQLSPAQPLSLRRAYAEVLTPVGLLAGGRMGSHFGLGLLANGGDCADCDRGDAADRVVFVTPIAGHLWAVAYDLSATGPSTPRASGRVVDLDPADDVRSVTFAALAVRDDLTRDRRRAAGKTTIEYGAFVSHRWQDRDAPASWLSLAAPAELDAAQVVPRGLAATGLDAWARLTLPWLRVEAEAAVLLVRIDQLSTIPGVLLAGPLEGTQVGGVLETEAGERGGRFRGGIDLGFASGDGAPGFGTRTDAGAGQPGDLHAAQAVAPHDLRLDEFRFHPDYRIDRILFRELVGTVADAAYVRPHVAAVLHRTPRGAFEASLFAVGSMTVEEASAPGGKRPLGIEVDPSLGYASDDGFELALEHAVLFPLEGLDNPTEGLAARPAQALRLRASLSF